MLYDQDDPEAGYLEGDLFVLIEIMSHQGQTLWSRVVDLRLDEIELLRRAWLEDLSASIGRRYTRPR